MNKPTFDRNRALSWSSISSFEYNPEEWYSRYVLKERGKSSPEMEFGKWFGECLAKDPDFLPQIPRLSKFEHAFTVVFDGIPLIGYADSFDHIGKKSLKEYKTGVKKWDQRRVDSHGQIDMYLLMHYITEKITPEEVECELVWIPTKRVETGDFEVKISLVDPVMPRIFKTKRTMSDLLKFGSRIKKVYKEMIEYCENRPVDKVA